MATRLPLVAAQPGIWMAEQLSTLPSAWSVAHYIELRGQIDPQQLCQAIVCGLSQADTLSLRFSEENGEIWQWLTDNPVFAEPACHDLRTAADPEAAALSMMQADLAQDLRAMSGHPWSATSYSVSLTTAGSGISVIIIYWWMVLVFRRSADKSSQSTVPGSAVKRHRLRRSRPLRMWRRSTSAIRPAKRVSVINSSGRRNVRCCRRRSPSPDSRWRHEQNSVISGG